MSEDTQKHGHFCWNELLTKDVEATKTFYTKLLGWAATEQPMESGPYVVFKKDDKDVAGLMQTQAEWGDVQPHWMAYITVDDVDASAKQVEELGGKISMPPTDVPSLGRFCVITDPTGATVSLFTFAKK